MAFTHVPANTDFKQQQQQPRNENRSRFKVYYVAAIYVADIIFAAIYITAIYVVTILRRNYITSQQFTSQLLHHSYIMSQQFTSQLLRRSYITSQLFTSQLYTSQLLHLYRSYYFYNAAIIFTTQPLYLLCMHIYTGPHELCAQQPMGLSTAYGFDYQPIRF
jgi:hypothetical protein